MRPPARDAQKWTRLDVELAGQLDQLTQIVSEIRDRRSRLRKRKPGTDEILALGKWIHDFYVGVERILIRIAQDLNGGVPAGSDWHKRLLEQLSRDLPGVRPRVISPETGNRLKPFLRFRHLYRNIYALDLVWNELVPLLEEIGPLFRRLGRETSTFRKFLLALSRS